MITRFAPSPTGPLHLGHAFSALVAWDMALAAGGAFLLRIEDIDQGRSRPEWVDAIVADLTWLGLSWPTPPMIQSHRLAAYDAALDRLWADGVLYRCTCTRRDIAAAIAAPQEGTPSVGPDGVIYPGTCRPSISGNPTGPRPEGVLRLDMRRALDLIGLDRIGFDETAGSPHHVEVSAQTLIESAGDIVLARRDMGTSYHLSVVIDDAAQTISHVVRGADLAEATAIHIVLQKLLGLATPAYHHHRLIRDDHGKRLAKRDDARAIAAYRDAGETPATLRARLGLPPAP